VVHAGLELSRRALAVCVLCERGERLDRLAVRPDVESLRRLAGRIDEVHAEPVCAGVESMTGAGVVDDTLERDGGDVEIRRRPEGQGGLAPLACKTDDTDPLLLATPSQRDLVPAIWLPDPRVREVRELARFRTHLVRHKSALKNRVPSTTINFGRPCPVTDRFGAEGSRRLARLDVPEPWRSNVTAAPEPSDPPRAPDRRDQPPASGRPRRPSLYPAAFGRARDPRGARVHDRIGDRRERALVLAREADRLHRALPTRRPAGRARSPRPALKARADLSALGIARRRRCTRSRPPPIASATNKRRLGKRRGAKVAHVDIARRSAHAIRHTLTRNQEFAPRRAAFRLAA
jgi:transposase